MKGFTDSTLMEFVCLTSQTAETNTHWTQSDQRAEQRKSGNSITNTTSLKIPEDHWFHFRFICPIHPYSAATIQAASYDETIVIQALGTLCLYTMHSN